MNYSIIPDLKRSTNEVFLKKAIDCEPRLKETTVKPINIISIKQTKTSYPDVEITDSIENLSTYKLKKGDNLCLDFGNHQVGYVTLKLSSVGSPQDAPAYFKIKFGEIAKEMTDRSEDYNGWISRSWIQEEFIHIDVLPTTLELSRRYAFQFIEISVIDTSAKWQLVIDDVICKSVSAVTDSEVELVKSDDSMIKKLDEVSIRTLQNCMQSVFEDGPKRDRRLWLGDLRLQALANYYTFKNYDLVKRCLYLFAALTRDDGMMGACLFTEPEYIVDDSFLIDYSLLFIPTLYDYYKATEDKETLAELWPSAYKQYEIIKAKFDENNLAVIEEGFTCFVDWTEGLDKQASLQAIYIYCLKRAVKIAKLLNDLNTVTELEHEIDLKTKAALNLLWDSKEGLFVSGNARQISYASQVWMVLAEVVSSEDGAEILKKVNMVNPEKSMVSPYMNHHYVEALLLCGEKEQALNFMKYYWGGMIDLGATAFWELYNPKNPAESPYGSSIVNSYCHAWSCTPTYLIRKYF